MTAAEKLKEIGKLLAQAFKVNEPETQDPAPAPDPAPTPEPAPQEFSDPVPPAEPPAEPSEEEARLVALETAVANMQQQLAQLVGQTQPAPAMQAMESRLEAIERVSEQRGQAFRLQHQALENVLQVLEAFSEQPAAEPVERPRDTNPFVKRDGTTRSERVAKLLEKMNVKPAAAE